MTTMRAENPRYSNDHHTAIAYEAVYESETGEEARRSLAEVNNDDPKFYKIVHDFGDTTLVDNKQKFLESRGRKQRERDIEKNREKDIELFQYKTDLFDYNFIYNTSNRRLRRQIRKAQTIEEARFAAMMILVSEVFDIEPKNDRLSELLKKISED